MTAANTEQQLGPRLGHVVAGTVVVVLGGTGSLGQRLVRRLLELRVQAVRVFSRDEAKQAEMRAALSEHENVSFVLGDVRDPDATTAVMRGAVFAINAAALKQVPLCEEAPDQAVYTNVLGAANVRRAAIDLGLRRVVSLSTDKAVAPVNVMGMTKALHERLLLGAGPAPGGTDFVCVRYGNVLGSRGSVVPLLASCVRLHRPMRLTHDAMTRFVLSLDDAVDFILFALEEGQHGDLLVRKLPALRIVTLAEAIGELLANDADYPVEYIGIRPGEKLHEVLVSSEEMRRAVEFATHFRISRPTDLVERDVETPAYSSNRSAQLLTRKDAAERLVAAGLP